jgi:hypothetical protein
MSFSFWQKWLALVSIYHIVLGLLLAFFGQSQFMDALLNQYFDSIFWPDNQISSGTIQYKSWVSSVLGAVIASWGMLIAFIAYYPFKLREKWAWNGIAVSVVFWFLVDTACSLYYDVSINAVFNLFTFSLFVAPLFFTRKYLFGKAAA